MSPASRRRARSLIGALAAAAFPTLAAAQHQGHDAHTAAKPAAPAKVKTKPVSRTTRDSAAASLAAVPPRVTQRITRNGVAVEFSITPRGPTASDSVVEVEDAVVRLALFDSATGRPLSGQQPAAWIDRRVDAAPSSAKVCKEKVDGYVQAAMYMEGALKRKANVDLTSYFVLSLNRSPDITVIDPFLGFGRTKLYTTVRLKAIGADWKLSSDERWLFVSMPAAGAVAMIDTDDWKVVANLPAGAAPTRLALQPGERFVWVTNEPATGAGSGGITIVDIEKKTVAARVATGAGPHSIAFSDDGRSAFVANERAGTVTIVDARNFARRREIAVGERPVDVTWSPVGGAAYVVSEGTGTISVIDPATLAERKRIALEPGVRQLRFAPTVGSGHGGHGGHGAGANPAARFGFAINPRANTVSVIDATANELVRTTSVADSPGEIAFTSSFAYVRATSSPKIYMISLADPAASGVGALDQFEAGHTPPREGGEPSRAPAVVAAPDMPDAVYALNPKEKMIYYYHWMEGMPIPSGGLTTYGFDPKAVLVAGKDLRETEPGVYTATVKISDRGNYDLVFLLEDPRVTECFPLTVMPNPDVRKGRSAIEVTPVGERKGLTVGENQLRFRMTDLFSGKPLAGLPDVGVLATTPAGWQQRASTREIGDGVYEVSLNIPSAGFYYLSFQSATARLRFNDRPPLVLPARTATVR